MDNTCCYADGAIATFPADIPPHIRYPASKPTRTHTPRRHFAYRNGVMHCEDVSLEAITRELGMPNLATSCLPQSQSDWRGHREAMTIARSYAPDGGGRFAKRTVRAKRAPVEVIRFA